MSGVATFVLFPVVFVVNGILITGTFAIVIGFDVVIIVMFEGETVGGVVLIIGSIFTHFVPVVVELAKDWTLTQLAICCCWGNEGRGKIIGLWHILTGGGDGMMVADGGGDG